MSEHDGGAAFPHLHDSCQRVNKTEHWPGLSIRDYFAAKAMQGFLANPESWSMNLEDVAHLSVKQADTLMQALAIRTQPGQGERGE